MEELYLEMGGRTEVVGLSEVGHGIRLLRAHQTLAGEVVEKLYCKFIYKIGIVEC